MGVRIMRIAESRISDENVALTVASFSERFFGAGDA